MQYKLFEDLYKRNSLSNEELKNALDFLQLAYEYINLDLDSCSKNDLDKIVSMLVDNQLNTIHNFVILMRYFRLIDRKELFIHLTKYTGMLGVMEHIIKRLVGLKGKKEANLILGDFEVPYLGVHPEQLPNYVNQLMFVLDCNLESEETEHVLAGNNHGIPKESQLPEKVEYENSESLETYLEQRHARKVKELEEHLRDNLVWFEQIITQEIVDFVKSNQEVLSGVLKDNRYMLQKYRMIL